MELVLLQVEVVLPLVHLIANMCKLRQLVVLILHVYGQINVDQPHQLVVHLQLKDNQYVLIHY